MSLLAVSPAAAIRVSSLVGFAMIALAPLFFNAHNIFRDRTGFPRRLVRWFVCLGLGMAPGLIIILLIYLSPDADTQLSRGSSLGMALVVVTVMGAIVGLSSGILVDLTKSARVRPFSLVGAAVISLLATLSWVVYIEYFDPRLGRSFFYYGWDGVSVLFCILVAFASFFLGGFWPILNSAQVAAWELRRIPNRRLRRIIGRKGNRLSLASTIAPTESSVVGDPESALFLEVSSFPTVSYLIHPLFMALYWGAITTLVLVAYEFVLSLQIGTAFGGIVSIFLVLSAVGFVLGGILGLILGVLTNMIAKVIQTVEAQSLAGVGGLLLFVGVILQLPSHF